MRDIVQQALNLMKVRVCVCLCARPLKPLKSLESQINTIAFVSLLAEETVSCIEIENTQSDNESQRDRKEAGGEGWCVCVCVWAVFRLPTCERHQGSASYHRN